MRVVATSTERIGAHVADGVGWIVLNQPDKHNALSADMFAGIVEVMRAWQGDHDVRVVVVRGTGDRAFASGADIGELGTSLRGPVAGSSQPVTTLAIGKPVIAMIHGYCIGGGLMVAMEADLRIAAADATFAIPAGKLGAGYSYESIQRLVALVGPAWASMILLTGDRIDAATAARIGLVNEVVAKGDLEARVTAIAVQMAANSPMSLAASKAGIAAASGLAGSSIELAHELVRACWSSADFAEGRAAFAEKRPPRFAGH